MGAATSLPQLMAPGLLRAAASGSAWLPRGGPASSQRACCRDSIPHHLYPSITCTPAFPVADTTCTPSLGALHHSLHPIIPYTPASGPAHAPAGRRSPWLVWGPRCVPVRLGAARGWLALPDDVADVVRGPREVLRVEPGMPHRLSRPPPAHGRCGVKHMAQGPWLSATSPCGHPIAPRPLTGFLRVGPGLGDMGWRPLCRSALQGTRCYQHLAPPAAPIPRGCPREVP